MEVIRCVCTKAGAEPHFIRCSACDNLQHRKCVGKAVEMSIYECPSCQVVRCNPFFEVCGFPLPPRPVNTSADLPAMPRLASARAYLLCLQLTAEGYSVQWPQGADIRLDGMQIAGQIAAFRDLTTNLPKTIAVSTSEDTSEEFLWAVVLARRRSAVEVGQIISIFTESKSRSIELLFEHGTLEDTQIIVLPRTGRAQLQPVRGEHCAHFQCFDLEEFLQRISQEDVPGWRCPLCKQPSFSFRLDEVQKWIQKQFPDAAAVNVRKSSQPPPMGLSNPYQLPVSPLEPFSFRDFLTSPQHSDHASETRLLSSLPYTGIEVLWKKLNREFPVLGMATDLGITVVEVFQPIEID